MFGLTSPTSPPIPVFGGFFIRRKPEQAGVPLSRRLTVVGCDPMPTSSFDAETLDLMSRAFEVAWEEVGFALANKDADLTAFRSMMAVRIVAAVRDGERDPERLTELALEAVAKAY
jgi:hypothetical protein